MTFEVKQRFTELEGTARQRELMGVGVVALTSQAMRMPAIGLLAAPCPKIQEIGLPHEFNLPGETVQETAARMMRQNSEDTWARPQDFQDLGEVALGDEYPEDFRLRGCLYLRQPNPIRRYSFLRLSLVDSLSISSHAALAGCALAIAKKGLEEDYLWAEPIVRTGGSFSAFELALAHRSLAGTMMSIDETRAALTADSRVKRFYVKEDERRKPVERFRLVGRS